MLVQKNLAQTVKMRLNKKFLLTCHPPKRLKQEQLEDARAAQSDCKAIRIWLSVRYSFPPPSLLLRVPAGSPFKPVDYPISTFKLFHPPQLAFLLCHTLWLPEGGLALLSPQTHMLPPPGRSLWPPDLQQAQGGLVHCPKTTSVTGEGEWRNGSTLSC